MQGDVRLTRAALYILDRAGRREPMRFVLARPSVAESTVTDVSLREGRSYELRLVRVASGVISGLLDPVEELPVLAVGHLVPIDGKRP